MNRIAGHLLLLCAVVAAAVMWGPASSSDDVRALWSAELPSDYPDSIDVAGVAVPWRASGFDAETGRTLWRDRTMPILDGRIAYFPGPSELDGCWSLEGVDLRTGERVSRIENLPSPVFETCSPRNYTVAGGVVYATDWEPRFDGIVCDALGWLGLHRIAGSPVYRLYAMDPSTGHFLWRSEPVWGSMGTPVATNGVVAVDVYGVDESRRLFAFPTDGVTCTAPSGGAL